MGNRLDLVVRHRLTLVLASRTCEKDAGPHRPIVPTLTEWAGTNPWPVLWLRLKPEHNEPRFFIAALRRALSELVDLSPVTHLPPEDALVDLLNDLLEAPMDFVLVLEGYDAIGSERVHRLLARMLDYLPPQMHVIIVAHTEPELSNLPRLRVRRQVLTLSLTSAGLVF
ncbi:MAG: hypothetical protein ACP5JG_06135 [Anaerolineae bacterium]